MKILYFSDAHWDTAQVAKRSGNFADDVEAKLKEIREIATTCDYTLFGGDLFHKHRVAPELERRAIALFRDWPLFVTVGNHDLPADGIAGFDRTSMAVLAEALPETFHVVDTAILGGAQLSITHWSPALEPDKPVFDLGLYACREAREEQTIIKVAHGMILPPGGGWPFPAVGMDEIDANGIDLYLCSHTHWRTDRVGIFYGPGSVTRTARGQDHTPSVAVITLGAPGKFEIEEIALKSARPYADVFPAVDEAAPSGGLFTGYVSELERSGAVDTMTPEAALAQLAAAGTSPEVIEGARGYLKRAQEAMKGA